MEIRVRIIPDTMVFADSFPLRESSIANALSIRILVELFTDVFCNDRNEVPDANEHHHRTKDEAGNQDRNDDNNSHRSHRITTAGSE